MQKYVTNDSVGRLQNFLSLTYEEVKKFPFWKPGGPRNDAFAGTKKRKSRFKSDVYIRSKHLPTKNENDGQLEARDIKADM